MWWWWLALPSLLVQVVGRARCGEGEGRCVLGEMLFVPRIEVVKEVEVEEDVMEEELEDPEDNGWLMDLVYFPKLVTFCLLLRNPYLWMARSRSSAWVVWDARDLAVVATVHLPQRVGGSAAVHSSVV